MAWVLDPHLSQVAYEWSVWRWVCLRAKVFCVNASVMRPCPSRICLRRSPCANMLVAVLCSRRVAFHASGFRHAQVPGRLCMFLWCFDSCPARPSGLKSRPGSSKESCSPCSVKMTLGEALLKQKEERGQVKAKGEVLQFSIAAASYCSQKKRNVVQLIMRLG